MKRRKSGFPGIPRSSKVTPAENAITENIEVLTGARGNNRALLMSDLISLDQMKRDAIVKSLTNSGGGVDVDDDGNIVENPHAPVNLQGRGGFTFIVLTWDKPTYKGHAYAEIHRSDTDSFSSAVKITTVVSDIFSDTVDMGAGYYYWVRFVNKNDKKGPIQSANGLFVETQETAESILDAIGGQIEKSHLGDFLKTNLDNLNFDLYDLSGFVTLADESLKDAIEDPLGSSLGAVINQFHYTKAEADAAIAAYGVLLKAEIENPEGGGIEADFILNYLTKVDTLSAIALSINQLSSRFDSLAEAAMENALSNDLVEEKQRVATADIIHVQNTEASKLEATAQDVLQLSSNIDDVAADLEQNYYTFTSTDTAIAQATTTLKAQIEDLNGSSLGAYLKNNYYTRTTVNGAIASADLTLKSEIEDENGSSVGAALQQLATTVATNDEQWAMWAVKTTVNQLTSSFGLVNDGVDPIFAVKGAKFAIITSQDPNDLTPVFAVVDNQTVMSNALIDQAFIKNLVVDDLLANLVTVGSRFNTPSINYDPVSGTRSNNFSIDPGGNMEATSAVLQSVTIKSPGGDVVLNSSGELDGAWIKNLSVDTLAIAGNAVSAASSFSISSINVSKFGSNSSSSSYINHSNGVLAEVIVSLIVACKRTSGGGDPDKINVTGTVKTSSTTLVSQTVTVGIAGDEGSFHFIPFSFKVSTSSSISMSFSGSSLGETWTLSGKGAIHSAKR
jgi:phosphoribosylformylglycinamidine (FGAM) synthase PurS component